MLRAHNDRQHTMDAREGALRLARAIIEAGAADGHSGMSHREALMLLTAAHKREVAPMRERSAASLIDRWVGPSARYAGVPTLPVVKGVLDTAPEGVKYRDRGSR
jgi:hypothetical protein